MSLTLRQIEKLSTMDDNGYTTPITVSSSSYGTLVCVSSVGRRIYGKVIVRDDEP